MQVFVNQLGKWLVQKPVGIVTLTIGLLFCSCVFAGCVVQYKDDGNKKRNRTSVRVPLLRVVSVCRRCRRPVRCCVSPLVTGYRRRHPDCIRGVADGDA